MTEIEFKQKFDGFFFELEKLYENWEYEMDCTGNEVYGLIKKLHLLLGRMRRQIERRMKNG